MTILAVSGEEGFLRDRKAREIVRAYEAQGYSVDYVEGKDLTSVSDALSGGFFSVLTLVVIEDPVAATLPLFKDFEHPEKDVLVRVRGKLNGSTKLGKYLAGLPKHKAFPAPEKYKDGEAAEAFIFEEARAAGYRLDRKLAKAWVAKVGSDLGALHFELFKAYILADLRGTKTLDAAIIKEVVAPIQEASFSPLFDALWDGNKIGILKAMSKIREVASKDPTIPLIQALTKTIPFWYVAHDLIRYNTSGEVASKMKQSPWYVENKLLPQARRLGPDKIRKLLESMRNAEQAVMTGKRDPWLILSVGLISTF